MALGLPAAAGCLGGGGLLSAAAAQTKPPCPPAVRYLFEPYAKVFVKKVRSQNDYTSQLRLHRTLPAHTAGTCCLEPHQLSLLCTV